MTSTAVPVASALTGTTNKTANVYLAPYNTTEHITATIAANKSVTVIDRELDFLYVYYYDGSVRKSGYLKISDVNASGYQYHTYTHYESARNITTSSQPVYYCPDGKDQYGAIDSNEGEIYNKPLTILRQENGYSFVQYVINPQNDGSSNVIFKRGWVKSDVLAIDPKVSLTVTQNTNKFYIRNVATGLYLDLASYSITDGANIHLWEYHGGYNQEWILQPITTQYGSTYVRLLTNMASAQNKALRVATGAAIMNSNVDIKTVSNLRSQEFYFQETLDGYYYIRSRCGQNYMMLGVDPNDSGIGGDVLLRYPTSSLYNKWVVEAAREEGEHYNFCSSAMGKISSTVSDGIYATYDISGLPTSERYDDTHVYNYQNLARNALNSWSAPNKKITATPSESSPNKILWSDDIELKDTDGDGNNDLILATTLPVSNGSRSIVMYYGSHIISVTTPDGDYVPEDLPLLWQSTLAHEIGHTFGLDHPPIGIISSVLSYDRNDLTVTGPTMIDWSAAKKSYSPKK